MQYVGGLPPRGGIRGPSGSRRLSDFCSIFRASLQALTMASPARSESSAQGARMSDHRKKPAPPTPALNQAPSRLEKVAGNPLAEVGLTAATAVAGTAVATMAATTLLPLLPILAKSLAAGRQERRIARNLAAIEQVLIQHGAELERLSDEQYALINEVVLAAMGSTNDTKLAYLRNAVQNVLSLPELLPQEAVVLGRVVRDMSADEARFLMDHQGAERISIGGADITSALDHYCVDPDSNEALCVYGLLSLGVLTPGEAMYDTMGMLGFSRLAPKLVALLSSPPSAPAD